MNLRCVELQFQQGAFRLDLDFSVAGQVIGIFGNSGAGKTTLLELIAGLRRPDRGRIAFDPLILTDVRHRVFVAPEERGIGYVPQDLALFPHLTVRGNLDYGRKPEIGIPFDHVTGVLEIGPLLDRSISSLSGGQQQRVAFARALLSAPRLLLMDEPLSGLDDDLKLRIIPYLQRIRDEFHVPMLYVSHAPDEVAALCDQVLVLREGKCLRIVAPQEIFEEAPSMRLRPGIYGSS